MTLLGPHPRYRLYTTPGLYFRAAAELATHTWRRGDAIARFERTLERLLGTRVICVPQARVGIFLVLCEVVRPGGKVILSPYTIADVVNMVVAAGGEPVFADVEADTGNLDPLEVKRLIDADTAAVVTTHLHGLACNVETLRSICEEHRVFLLEDAAQALGTRVSGRWAGTVGHAGVLSFGRHKNTTSILGGACLISDAALANQVRRRLREYPLQDLKGLLHGLASAARHDFATHPLVFRLFGFRAFRYARRRAIDWLSLERYPDANVELTRELPESYRRRMSPLQARLGLAQLARVDVDARSRIRRALRYAEGLRGLAGLRLPPVRSDLSHTYMHFPIAVDNRSEFLIAMSDRGRDVGPQTLRNCATLGCFADFYRDCPNARKLASDYVLLPCYPSYPLGEVDRNVAAIHEYLGGTAQHES